MTPANMVDSQEYLSGPNASQRPEIAYTLRKLKYHELPAMARILSLAFWNDQLFGEMIHPNREEYPNDSDLYWLRDARVNFWDRHYEFIAAVVQDPDAPGRGKLIGIAQWERIGDGAKRRDLAWYDPSMFFYLSPFRTYPEKLCVKGVPFVDISEFGFSAAC
jgi:hypothetical protein